MAYIPKHELSGTYKLNHPPTKPWTARKVLVVAAAGRIDRDKLKTLTYSNLRMRYAQECIEAVINQWEQNDTHRAARKYYANASYKAIGRLIVDTLKLAFIGQV